MEPPRGGGAGTTASGGAGTTAASGEHRRGRQLVMGIEADTCSPWEPVEDALRDVLLPDVSAASTTPLDPPTEDGKFVPYLAESIEPNADYTVWTIKAPRRESRSTTARPSTAPRSPDNLKRRQASFLTGAVFSDVATNPDGSPQIVRPTA